MFGDELLPDPDVGGGGGRGAFEGERFESFGGAFFGEDQVVDLREQILQTTLRSSGCPSLGAGAGGIGSRSWTAVAVREAAFEGVALVADDDTDVA